MSTCSTCTDSTSCTSCTTTDMIVGSNGQCTREGTCLDGQTYVSGVCIACDSSCLTCLDGEPENCRACIPGAVKTSKSEDLCECMTGTVLVHGFCQTLFGPLPTASLFATEEDLELKMPGGTEEDLDNDDVKVELFLPDGTVVDPTTYSIELVKKDDDTYDIEIIFEEEQELPEDTKVAVEFTNPNGVTNKENLPVSSLGSVATLNADFLRANNIRPSSNVPTDEDG